MIWDELEPRLRTAWDSISAIGVGMIQAIIVILIARYVHRFIRDKLLERFDPAMLSETGRSMATIISSIAVGVISATVLLALWGVTWAGILTAVSLGTLGILLGIQDVLKSLIGGVFLVLERPYAIGDRVQFRDVSGRIIAIELRTTVLRSDSGYRVVAPNSIVFTDTITNFSMERQIRTTLVIRGLAIEDIALQGKLTETLGAIEGVDDSLEVVFLSHGRKVSQQMSETDQASAQSRRKGRNVEARVSWVGGGEPEVQVAVVEATRAIVPKATIRISKYGRAVGSESGRRIGEPTQTQASASECAG